MTATAIFSRIFMEPGKNKDLQDKAGSVVSADLPKWDSKAEHPTVDFYHWYDGTLALFLQDGPKGPSWKKWNRSVMDALCQNQALRKDGCADGSWSSEVDRWGFAGGRVYATAINVLTLEVYYRALPPVEDEKKQ